VVELRALWSRPRKRTDAGYFDGTHRDLMSREAMRLNKAVAAVYVTLNTLDPQMLGRYANRIEQNAQATTTDNNITQRRWLLLDFDPSRPKDTSATQPQVEQAKQRARDCWAYLNKLGWPDPAVAESANGYHLLYRIALPNDNGARDLLKGVLGVLAKRFDDNVVKLDQSVFNAARIVKFYGTVANKGDHTAAAPHRLSVIVAPPGSGIVTTEQLCSLAPPPAPNPPPAVAEARFDLEGFLSRLAIEYRQDLHEGRERYKLDHCPFNPEHLRGEAAIFRSVATGQLGFRCQHNGCADKTWRDVRALVDGQRNGSALLNRQPLDIPAPGETGGRANNRATVVVKPNGHDLDGAILHRLASDIKPQPIRWLWPGRIARGKVTVIAGHPGLGKSQVTASMAAIVSTGGQWPVDRSSCERGHVVIMSAEDDPGDTIRPRLEAAGADLTRVHIIDAVADGYRADGTQCQRGFRLDADTARLGTMLAQIGDVRLVVIDPITAYLGETDSHKNAEIRALLMPLADLAAKHGAAVLCISHLTKAGNTDVLMRVMGSLAFVAAARAAYVVARDQDDPARRLFLP
jgi:AAA domain